MKYIGAIDQGTTSTRFIIFDENCNAVASHQIEHKQIFPQPGWVEHDPWEIWGNTELCIREALRKAGLSAGDISGIGITNQRETIIPFNPRTGKVWYNAIVWQDLRATDILSDPLFADSAPLIQEITGLKMSPYFAGGKVVWLLRNVAGLREAAEAGEVVFGTIDTWLIWNLTGRKRVVTDATNASRYMLMNINTLQWDKKLLELFDIPSACLPEIVCSMGEVYGYTSDGAVPICGTLGDQQAALFGQACFDAGKGKCTYGTGCFMLVNTGEKPVASKAGLLTTVAYKIKGKAPCYALEGSVAVAGSLVQWVRDNLKLVENAQQLDRYAEEVEDVGGVYIVPAFSGLFAPYWRSDARGVIVGLTGYANRSHICRATLEATAFQAYDIFKAMAEDSGVEITELKVDGGLTNSRPLMLTQADLLGIPVVRPANAETTALGAAFAAGLTAGVFDSVESLAASWKESCRWVPAISEEEREKRIGMWHKAVEKALCWAE